MTRALRIVIGVGGSLAAICVVAFVAMIWASGIGRDMCGDTILSELPSPDGRLRAVVFDRSCGAVSHGSSTQVSVLASSIGSVTSR